MGIDMTSGAQRASTRSQIAFQDSHNADTILINWREQAYNAHNPGRERNGDFATVWCGKPLNDSLGSFRADVKVLRHNTQEAGMVFFAVRKHESPQRWCGSHFRE